MAERPLKTLFHEIAHVLLHIEADTLTDTDTTPRNIQEVEAEAVAMLCCASLNVPEIEYSRGYIQSWSEQEPVSSKSAQRIFAAADKILKAGTRYGAKSGQKVPAHFYTKQAGFAAPKHCGAVPSSPSLQWP